MAERKIEYYWNPEFLGDPKRVQRLTFWVLTARFRVAKSEAGSTVPRKIALNWFIPAFAKRRVGSDSGTTEDDDTILFCISRGSVLEWGGGGFSTNSDNEIDRRTNGVAIFLKVLQKGLPHTTSRPLHIHGSRGSHCIRQTMRDEA